jgi:hypothetical protein
MADMGDASEHTGGSIFQLRATLGNTRPPVWRRLQVPAGITLHRLHLIIQAAMGWENYHLYRFEIGRRQYGEPHPDNDHYELDFKNSKRANLGRLLKNKGASFRYEYDFGDGWIHELLVEDVFEPQPDKLYPTCVDGQRACPPEDCGGPWGYNDLLDIVKDPLHEEYLEKIEWLGRDFDPEAFDVTLVNLRLARLRRRT